MDHDLLRRAYVEHQLDGMSHKDLMRLAHDVLLADLYEFEDDELVEELDESDPDFMEEFRSKT